MKEMNKDGPGTNVALVNYYALQRSLEVGPCDGPCRQRAVVQACNKNTLDYARRTHDTQWLTSERRGVIHVVS
jgi:hypothetical protein